MTSLFSWQFALQSLIVVTAICVALYIFNSSAATDSRHGVESQFDMLAHLDEKIACQENEKDVRCWSSVNKIQMFLAGSRITHEAISVRIENHMQLIDSIWNDSISVGLDNGEIPKASLTKVLSERFPHEIDAVSKEVKFRFSQESEPVLVMSDALKDYRDTIEAWRLLQTWASRKTDRQGRPGITPVFSKEALEAFYEFLSAFDIALLKHASQIANERKLAEVDAESMNMAFMENRQQGAQ